MPRAGLSATRDPSVPPVNEPSAFARALEEAQQEWRARKTAAAAAIAATQTDTGEPPSLWQLALDPLLLRLFAVLDDACRRGSFAAADWRWLSDLARLADSDAAALEHWQEHCFARAKNYATRLAACSRERSEQDDAAQASNWRIPLQDDES